jgi:peptidylprolyl isomerase
MRAIRSVCLLLVLCVSAAVSPFASVHARAAKPLLTKADIDDITQLVMLEDTRHFDEGTLTRLLGSTHPEVRRRTVLAVGRIVNARGSALLVAARTDANPEVVATVAFASGQLKDATSVPWLAEILSAPKTPPAIAKEAACALGKIRSPEARAALGSYLLQAPATTAAAPVVGEALLSMGRFTTFGDLAPILHWTAAKDAEVRWRAAWALFRPRDPAAIPHLLKLAEDASGDVRMWAVRGLTPPAPPAPARGGTNAAGGAAAAAPIDWTGVDRASTSARLRDAARDTDRRVRTEAIRALAFYEDDASFAVVLAALDSPDTWISVSAAEAMGRFPKRADVIVPKLIAAAGATRPTALRLTALTPLVTLAPDAAIDVASSLLHEKSTVARSSAAQALQRLGERGKARFDELAAADPAIKSLMPQPGAGRGARPAPTPRTDAEYRRIVETWIVPDYNGAAKPHTIWDTPKGQIEIELYPGDAPLGLEHLIRVVESGSIVGTEFSRVVPNFVAQQAGIRDASTLRDEVNRHGLTRGNLSWASAGLDTGRPGYTLGSTPQPHNEGDFTALGRIVRGLDVVDHLELGDAITGARMKR